MKNLLFTLCFLSGFVFIGFAQDDSNKIESVMIRVYEKFNPFDKCVNIEIHTIKPDYSTEIKNTDTKNLEKVNKYISLKKELDKWVNKGYKVVSSTINSTDQDFDVKTTYYLIKKD